MADDMADWSWVPKREWEWPEDTWICGVHTYVGQFVWWRRQFGPTGYRW